MTFVLDIVVPAKQDTGMHTLVLATNYNFLVKLPWLKKNSPRRALKLAALRLRLKRA
jgi:hypothetical protein